MTERDEEKKAELARRATLLRQALEASGLKQEEFANNIKMDRPQFNGYLNGKRPFGASVEARFEKGFGLPRGYFARPQVADPQPDVGATLADVLDELQLLRDEVDELRVAVRQFEDQQLPNEAGQSAVEQG